jgi:hypothetical protein
MPHKTTDLYSTRISFKGDDQLVPMLEDQNSADFALVRARNMTLLEKQDSLPARDWIGAFEVLLSDQAIAPGGVEPHSNCSRNAVNQCFFEINLSALTPCKRLPAIEPKS